MSETGISQHALATALAARLVHDLAGPVSGISTGLDLLADPDSADMKASAMELTASSLQSLMELLDFCRVAFGRIDETHTGEALARLASTLFAGRRPRLEWSLTINELPGPAAQAILILTQIAAAALAAGGTARVSASMEMSGFAVLVEGQGLRAPLHKEVLDVLKGGAPAPGISGRWAPAAYLRALVTDLGGEMSAMSKDESFTIRVSLPA